VSIHRSSGWLDFHVECDPSQTTSGGTPIMTRAMDPEVADAIWAAIEPILPDPGR
jgi:hypothetical protein